MPSELTASGGMMDLRWLEDFMALARTRHFSRAAELQHVSQPTFSRRIKLLEEAMGTTLIDRQTLPLELTPAGEIFLEFCERVSRDVRDTRDRIEDLEQEAESRISVGATQSLFSHFYQEWVEALGVADHMQLNLKSTNWLGEQFLDALDDGECELVLCYWHNYIPWRERLSAERYEWMTLGQEWLVPLSVADDKGNPRYSLPGNAEQPVPLIAHHPRGFLFPAIEAHISQSKVPVSLLPLNESAHSASIKALVKQGFGMGWLPQRMTEKSEQFGRLVRAGDEHWDIPVDICLIRLREPRSEQLLTLWKLLEEQHHD